jgi:nucleoid DNA-binding protein
MNKQELINQIMVSTGLTKKQATDALDATVTTISESLEQGESVTITGFGTFEVSERAARNGVNPQTRESISIPASTVPKFRASTALKAALKE